MQKRIKLLEVKFKILNIAIVILSIGLILLRLKFLYFLNRKATVIRLPFPLYF